MTLIDELHMYCPPPTVIYCINDRVYASRRAVTLALRQRRHGLRYLRIHALDAFPEPDVFGWRECTDEFIIRGLDGYGIIYANGQVLWT